MRADKCRMKGIYRKGCRWGKQGITKRLVIFREEMRLMDRDEDKETG